jgi:cobalamin biosynthesis Co2+ chelatase CbiK
MGNLDWDKETFSTPQKMMADFKAKGVKTVLITEPFILSSSDKWQEACDWFNDIYSDFSNNVRLAGGATWLARGASH